MAFVVTVQSNYCCDEFLALFRWSNLCTDSDRSELRLMRMVHTRERSGPSAYAITIFIAVKLHQHYRAFTKQIIIAQKRSRRMITTRLCDRWLTVSIFFFILVIGLAHREPHQLSCAAWVRVLVYEFACVFQRYSAHVQTDKDSWRIM